MRANEIKKMMKMYGDITLSELFEKLKLGRTFECPKCKGKGFTTEMVDMYPRGLPDSGWATDFKPVNTDCDLCDGIGYTGREYKVKIETKIVGYE